MAAVQANQVHRPPHEPGQRREIELSVTPRKHES